MLNRQDPPGAYWYDETTGASKPGSVIFGRGTILTRSMLDGSILHDLIVTGDREANAALSEIGAVLGRAAMSICAVLDSEIVVFGGGVADTGENLLRPVREAFALAARGQRPSP